MNANFFMPILFVIAIATGHVQAFPTNADDLKPKKDDATAMVGKWAITSAELAGQALPAEVTKSMTLILEKGKYTLKSPSPDDIGTTSIDATKTPKEIDIKGSEGPNKGRTMLAIYILEGETMKICYDTEGKKRPTEFKTAKGTKQFLAEYMRMKE